MKERYRNFPSCPWPPSCFHSPNIFFPPHVSRLHIRFKWFWIQRLIDLCQGKDFQNTTGSLDPSVASPVWVTEPAKLPWTLQTTSPGSRQFLSLTRSFQKFPWQSWRCIFVSLPIRKSCSAARYILGWQPPAVAPRHLPQHWSQTHIPSRQLPTSDWAWHRC